MIDLEDALAPLVEHAPEPPAVERIVRRGRTRRRRRAAALATTLVVVVALAIGAIATIAERGPSRVAGVPDDTDHVRVTLLDGAQLTISGPPSLGLPQLQPSFNAEMDLVGYKGLGPLPGHAFSVQRPTRQRFGVVADRYPTGDGHELELFHTDSGVVGVVEYDNWNLVVRRSTEPSDWAGWAPALDASETPDGFLVVRSRSSDWKVGPTDAPDVMLGGSYGFWGPSTYPAVCPNEAPDHYWRCFPDARVRAGAVDRTLGPNLADLDVSYTPPPSS